MSSMGNTHESPDGAFVSSSTPPIQLPATVEPAEAATLAWAPNGTPWPEKSDAHKNLTAMEFLHSLRRRWALATGWGLLAGFLLGSVLWLLIPVEFEAITSLRVRRYTEDTATGQKEGATSDRDFEVYCQTQANLVRSPVVLDAALREPAINQLPMVREQKNQLAWLTKKLKVSYPEQSEILRISMKGKNEEQLTKVVDAVKDAYIKGVVNAERQERDKRLDRLKLQWQKNDQKLLKDSGDVIKLAQDVGLNSAQVHQQLDIQELIVLRKEQADIQRRLREARNQIAMLTSAQQMQSNRYISDYEMLDHLESDPQYGLTKQDLLTLQDQYQQNAATARPNSSSLQRLGTQIATVQQQLDRLAAELKPRIRDRILRERGIDEGREAETLQLLQIEEQQLTKTLDDYRQGQVALKQQALAMRGKSADLESRMADLETLRKSTDTMWLEIGRLELALKNSPRIELLHDAIIPNPNNLKTKLVSIGTAFFVAFCGAVVCVVVWDSQGRRVNDADDVKRNVNLNVLGTIPLLQGGGLPFGRLSQHELEGMLNDSIDGIRTRLIYAKDAKVNKIIMVTSAGGREGKTTVASQLAISLARSGRRTLLVDGDLRNPQQHNVFGIASQRGLCEVLRGETGVDDVTLASPVERLWIIPAGYCDQESIQSLAKDSVEAIFEELKLQFDFIVLDSGPVLTCADPLLLGQYADLTVLSVRRDVSQLPKIEEAVERLGSVDIPILGVVVNAPGAESRRGTLALTHNMTEAAH